MKFYKSIAIFLLAFSAIAAASVQNALPDKNYPNLITIAPTEVDWSFADTSSFIVPADGNYQLIVQENNWWMLSGLRWQYGIDIASVEMVGEAPNYTNVTTGLMGKNTRLRKFLPSDTVAQDYYLSAGTYTVIVSGRCTLVQTNSAQGHQGYYNLELRAMP